MLVREAAGDLVVHEHGIDDGSAVVRDPVAEQVHCAQLPRDLHRHHVDAVRKRPVRGLVREARLEAGIHPGRQVLALVRRPRHRGHREGAAGRAAHATVAVHHLDIVGARLQEMGGRPREVGAHRARGLEGA